jgi:hypothetical protein
MKNGFTPPAPMPPRYHDKPSELPPMLPPMTEVTLPEPDTVSLAYSGRSPDYINGYEAGYEKAADQLREYARQAVLMERERCAKVCEEIDRADTTCRGDLPDLSEFAAAIRRG